MKTSTAPIRRTVKARDIPRAWGVALPNDPDATVEVVITPTPQPPERSLRRFFGAGKGLFSSADEIDVYVRRNRDAWEE